MATCDLGYEHEDQEPTIVEAPDTEPVAEAAVLIAEIEAERDVTLAKISAKAEEIHDETEVEVLRGELRVLREMVERLAPEPEPEPVPVLMDAPPVADEEPELPAPEPAAEPKPRSSRKNPWW